jgi:hypothetical protein
MVDEEEAFLAIRRDPDIIVLRLEAFAEGLGYLSVVLDNQDSHGDVFPDPQCATKRSLCRTLRRCQEVFSDSRSDIASQFQVSRHRNDGRSKEVEA